METPSVADIYKKSILERVYDFVCGDSDMYQEMRIGYWRTNNRAQEFPGRTLSGFKIKYKLTLHIHRVNDAEFKAARMLEEEQIESLIYAFNEDFLSWMKETNRYFYLDSLYGIGHVIHATDAGEIEDEINCSGTTKAHNDHKFLKYGCLVELILLDVRIDTDNEALLWENCFMIDRTTMEHLENKYQTLKLEEAWNMVLLREWLRLNKAWKEKVRIGSNRNYTGKWIEVQVENQGNEIVLRWNYKNDSESARFHLRGFRKEGGFAIADDDTSQGTLVIDRWGPDWKSERLEMGKTYFYTFKISFRHNKSGDDAEQERLRFEITTPSDTSIDEFAQRMNEIVENSEKEKNPPPDPRREKVNRAIDELRAFVEFDESLTQWENDLIKQIESKGYSPEEQEDKIERLKLAVESLRVEGL